MRKGIMTPSQMNATSISYTKIIQTKEYQYSNPYEKLGYAIICFACDDYRLALKSKNEELKIELERFFNSDWGNTLAQNLDAKFLMESIKIEFV